MGVDSWTGEEIVAQTFAMLAREQRFGSYHVHRGPYAIGSHDWERKPRVFAISVGDSFPWGDEKRCDLLLGVFAQIPQGKRDGGIDDGLQAEMKLDVEACIHGLITRKVDGVQAGQAIRKEIEKTEVLDQTGTVQGMLLRVPILFV